ncbi:MAG: cytochrome C oxidase subunit IV family protein [Candidatus Dadabacteria bacterium]|nr:cytochrome C oxidase subunit IV family protein [Candidatus Dadabacteria bacterium]
MSTETHELGGHIVPYKDLVLVVTALVILTGITVFVSTLDFGYAALNIFIAMAIASVKACLVSLWFMHLKFEDVITWIFIIFSLVLLCLLIGFSLSDEFLRITPKVNF